MRLYEKIILLANSPVYPGKRMRDREKILSEKNQAKWFQLPIRKDKIQIRSPLTIVSLYLSLRMVAEDLQTQQRIEEVDSVPGVQRKDPQSWESKTQTSCQCFHHYRAWKIIWVEELYGFLIENDLKLKWFFLGKDFDGALNVNKDYDGLLIFLAYHVFSDEIVLGGNYIYLAFIVGHLSFYLLWKVWKMICFSERDVFLTNETLKWLPFSQLDRESLL